MSLLDKEPIKRVKKILEDFDSSKKVIVLDTSARTAFEAASSLGCEVQNRKFFFIMFGSWRQKSVTL